jgi:hypothetical protein
MTAIGKAGECGIDGKKALAWDAMSETKSGQWPLGVLKDRRSLSNLAGRSADAFKWQEAVTCAPRKERVSLRSRRKASQGAARCSA